MLTYIYICIYTSECIYVYIYMYKHKHAHTQIHTIFTYKYSHIQEAFEKFYLSKHQGRRLSWHNSLAHCSLKARIGMSKEPCYAGLFLQQSPNMCV